MEFQPWPKIPRYNRGILITEKLDGTNAQVRFTEITHGVNDDDAQGSIAMLHPHDRGYVAMHAGSRKRWVQPGKVTDNYGFAAWAQANAAELYDRLGYGGHYGEWYGVGIQRGYDLVERRFALFNVDKAEAVADMPNVEVVPTLHRGDWVDPNLVAQELGMSGSLAVPGYDRPEGVVVFHYAGRTSFKILLEGDDVPKGEG